MSDAFSKVRPGEPLKIAAQAWNQVIDQVTTRPRFDAATSAAPPINFQVRCRNSTTGDVPRWGVLQITGILETPTGATGAYATGPQEPGTISFLSYPGVVGVTPTSDAGARFVVATQPIKAGEVGMAAIDGVVQVKLDVTASGDRFAGVKPGSVQQLRTGTSGDAAVLWKEGGTGVKWGLVRIGVGGSGGASVIRLGQFTGAWPNEPGDTGSDNLKLVKLYVQNANASGPNDWVPELDSEGEEVVAVTMNLFSYIPTRSGNDSYMWCAVLPISEVDGEYWTGAYDNVEGEDVPVMRPYNTLWLLLAAEC